MPVARVVKRHVEEEPFKHFVSNIKKRKIDDPDQNKIAASTIHKFTSVQAQDDKIKSRITRLKSKEDAKDRMSKIRHPDITSRNRQEILLKSHSNRFLLTNCSRTTEIDEEEEVPENSSQRPQPVENFVYDLHATEENHQELTENDDPIENLLRFVVMFEEMYVSMKLI